MRRRELVALLAGAGAAWPFLAHGEGPRGRPLIGYIAGGKRAVVADLVEAFQQGMLELGHKDGADVDITYRFAEAQPERLPGLADEMVRLNPAVILAGAVDSAVATRNLTKTIPIVSPALADAVRLGLVVSESHPSGNVTGITPYIAGLPAKQLEIALEIVPGAAAVGLLGNMNDPKVPPQRQEIEAAAQSRNVKVIVPDVNNAADIPGAIQRLVGQRVGVLVVLQGTMMLSERQQIAIAAAANRLPAVYGYRQHVLEGGLISYGVDLRWCFHRAATFVNKILNGAQPGDLPLEFPTRIEMAVNLKTAGALGITIPTSILARADEVIE